MPALVPLVTNRNMENQSCYDILAIVMTHYDKTFTRMDDPAMDSVLRLRVGVLCKDLYQLALYISAEKSFLPSAFGDDLYIEYEDPLWERIEQTHDVHLIKRLDIYGYEWEVTLDDVVKSGSESLVHNHIESIQQRLHIADGVSEDNYDDVCDYNNRIENALHLASHFGNIPIMLLLCRSFACCESYVDFIGPHTYDINNKWEILLRFGGHPYTTWLRYLFETLFKNCDELFAIDHNLKHEYDEIIERIAISEVTNKMINVICILSTLTKKSIATTITKIYLDL